MDAYEDRFRAFGWDTRVIDGHDVDQIDAAFQQARTNGRPTAVIARTLKGRGVAAVENMDGAHGKALDDSEGAIAELGGARDLRIDVSSPDGRGHAHDFGSETAEPPRYEVGQDLATRKAYGEAIAALGRTRGDIVALDAEVSNSTYAEIFANAHPERYFEMYIAEQQMIAAAVGMQVRNWRPFASTFAAFLTRAYDFIRMAAVSRASLSIVGSHAGCSIGEDGPSQMGLEDIAAFRAVHSSTVLYPCDPNQTADLVWRMADLEGISYLRTTRSALPTIYEAGQEFPVGGSRLVRSDPNDEVTIVAAGITVHEALGAATVLEADGIQVRIIDLYSIKPLDADTLAAAARETSGLICVEDHWAAGGLGDAVLAALAEGGEHAPVRKLAVHDMPTSGTPQELMRAAGIDRKAIASAVREMISSATHQAA